ncbi:MAG: sugar phosphate isomerase/epimerase [Desulfomonile sp.]|nr:sugar phosphate isomerase/epimerase [Desulfomonile sp.]
MKLSFSTNAFVNLSVFDAVETIAGIGYEGVELLADIPHLYADSVTVSDLDNLKRILDRTGVSVANINANTAIGFYGRQFWEPLFEPSLANPAPALRQWRIGYSKKCIDLAEALGAPCVSLTSGRPVPGSSPDESLRFLQESLQTLLGYAEDKSIRIGIEYEPGLLVERYEELAALIETLGSPYLGANLDLGHSHVLGEDVESVIAGLSLRIFHVHIEDIRGRKHYHLVPGTGEMDFVALFDALARHGYDGFATVELYTYPHRAEAAAREALHYLESLPPFQSRGAAWG